MRQDAYGRQIRGKGLRQKKLWGEEEIRTGPRRKTTDSKDQRKSRARLFPDEEKGEKIKAREEFEVERRARPQNYNY